MKEYTVSFRIDVDAKNTLQAAARAWELLSGPDATLPIAEVSKSGSKAADCIDLSENPELLSWQYRQWLFGRE